MYRHLLVLVEDTDAGIEAIGRSTEFAHGIGARITFLCAAHGKSAVASSTAADIASELLARAEAGARAQGVPCASVIEQRAPTLAPAIDYAHGHGCDLICMASPRGFAALPDVSRPAILAYGTDWQSEIEAPISALVAAHRTLIAALHGCVDAVHSEQNREQASGSDARETTLRERIEQLRDLPARGFRAKTKASLFRRLRRRTMTVNAELDELERLHQRDDELLDELSRLVGQNTDSAQALKQLEHSVSAYLRFVSEWMGREQGVILPAARRYLSDADWSAINAEMRGAASGGTANHHPTPGERERSRA